MIARILRRRISDKDNECLPPIEGQPTSTPLFLPNTKGSVGEKAASATVTLGATPMTPFRRTKEGRESGAKEPNTEVQDSDAEAEVHSSENEMCEKQLREKERHLRIREAEVQDVEKVLRLKERDLQIRETEVQKMLQAVYERKEAMGLQENSLRQRPTAMQEWEENPEWEEGPEWGENPCLRGPSLTQQMTIAREPNGTARESNLCRQSYGTAQESDLFSLSSISTIRNSPRVRGNVDLSFKSSAELKQDSWYGNELVSLASTACQWSGSSKHSNIDSSSSKSHSRLKDDSEYYGNE